MQRIPQLETPFILHCCAHLNNEQRALHNACDIMRASGGTGKPRVLRRYCATCASGVSAPPHAGGTLLGVENIRLVLLSIHL